MSRKRKKNIHIKPVIGIYCEGESEEQYFKMLCQKYNAGNIHPQQIKVKALGESGQRLIDAAVKKGRYLHQSKIYVAFDRDEKTDEELRACQRLAKKYDVTILFSSVCFEIWVLMHFELVMRAYTRRDLFDKLSGPQYFNQDYRRFKGLPYRHFLYDRVGSAIKNAQKLYVRNHEMTTDDPYTNIHLSLGEIYSQKTFWPKKQPSSNYSKMTAFLFFNVKGYSLSSLLLPALGSLTW